MPSDLRSFIKDAEAAGRLYRVRRQVDPHKNLAALSDESDRAVVFENIAGYEGWTVVDGINRNRTMEAVSFKTTRDNVVRTVAGRLDHGPRPHKVVATGPVKEVIWHGEEANLKRLPIPIHSELDGGPYIGGGLGVIIDPETGFHNTTFPRLQVRDGKHCPFLVYSPHVARILGKYARRKQPMQMAVVIGHHPAWEIAAASSMHHPLWGEFDWVGSLLEEDVTFVKCETIDVDVPAWAEIVIEGEVQPGIVADEGPFGNYLGTYASGPTSRAGVAKAPVYVVKCITMRRNPIFRHLQATVWTDHQRLCMLSIEANLYTALTEIGVDVHDVYCPPWGAASTTLLQMTPHFPGEAQDALLKTLEFENSTLFFMSQVAIAVNRDVNVYDARDIIWALAVRTNWPKNATVIPGTRCSPIMPVADRVEGAPLRLGGKVMIDATHLPARNETERWEYNRIWPMGKGTVSLKEYVGEGYQETGLHQERVFEDSPTPPAPRAEPPREQRPVEFVRVARVDELEEGVGHCVEVGDEMIALFKIGKDIYALNNICPHMGGSLADGELCENLVSCPLHGWTFNVQTGDVVEGEIGTETYPVQVQGAEIAVGIRK
ncbi:MAG: UbiD family decarboxylase domain-containing protein [Candidatus Binatia bacterium]